MKPMIQKKMMAKNQLLAIEGEKDLTKEQEMESRKKIDFERIEIHYHNFKAQFFLTYPYPRLLYFVIEFQENEKNILTILTV